MYNFTIYIHIINFDQRYLHIITIISDFKNSVRGGQYGLAKSVIFGSSNGRDVHSTEKSGGL